MQRNSLLWIGCAILFATTTSAMSAGKGKASVGYVPAFTKADAGNGLHRITLEDSAIARLGLESAEVTMEQIARPHSLGGRIHIPDGTEDVFVSVPQVSGINLDGATVAIIANVNGKQQKVTGARDVSFTASQADATGDRFYFKLPSGSEIWADGQQVLTEIASAGSSAEHKIVPYSALLYDKVGKTWIYLNESGVYKRQEVEVAFIEGDKVALSMGPEVGTPIVTIGAVELLGIENDVGF